MITMKVSKRKVNRGLPETVDNDMWASKELVESQGREEKRKDEGWSGDRTESKGGKSVYRLQEAHGEWRIKFGWEKIRDKI